MPNFIGNLVARSEGFEPPTPRFEVWCSIQLSYERRGFYKALDRDLVSSALVNTSQNLCDAHRPWRGAPAML